MAELPQGNFWEWVGSSPESPTVLAFCGFGGSPQDFEPAAKALCGGRLNWLIPQLDSFIPLHLPDEEPETLRQDFLKAIHLSLEQRGVRRPIVMGYSMGGRMALKYALMFQESVSGLILESATPGIRDSNLMAERRQVEEEWISTIENEGVVAFQEYWQSLPALSSQERIPEEIKTAMRRRRCAVLPRELIFSLKLFGQGVFPSLWSDLGALGVPLLLVAGQDDAKYLGLAQCMKDSIPHADVDVIGGVGHTAHLEDTAAFASSCEKFINNLEVAD